MRKAGQHLHGLNPLAADLVLTYFIRTDAALLNQAMTCHDDEKLPLGVMPMFALGNARLRDIHRELAAVQCLQQLRKAAALVLVHLQVEDGLLCRKVGQIGRIKLFRKAVVRNLRQQQRLRLLLEQIQQLHNLAQRHLNGTAEHHRTSVAVLLERIEQRRR